MDYRFRDEVINAKKAAMGEMYNLAKADLKPGEKIINFASGHPATDIFQDEMLKRYMSQALIEGEKNILQYGPHIGYRPLITQFEKYVNHDGCSLKEDDQLMVTYGNVEGIFL